MSMPRCNARSALSGRLSADLVLASRRVRALAALCYLYLLLTGSAFWTPGLYWIAIALGGGLLSRMVHPYVGVLFAVLL